MPELHPTSDRKKRGPAVPRYIGDYFAEAPPGHRFSMYLAAWDENFGLLKDKKRESLEEILRVSEHSCDLIAAVRERQAQAAQAIGPTILHLSARSMSPFISGTGIEHPLENGFAFLNPYGIPYLAGSSIKGTVRRAAEELALEIWRDRKGWDIPSVWWLFGFEANSACLTGSTSKMPGDIVRQEAKRWREQFRASIASHYVDMEAVAAFIERAADREMREKYAKNPEAFLDRLIEEERGERQGVKLLRDSIHFKGGLHFWDALIAPADNTLAIDILNPHFADYYQNKSRPTDCGQPQPNFFLTVPPGSQFDFYVQALEARLPEKLSRQWRLLIQSAFQLAFDWLGFGAKGAVGYGRMQSVQQGAGEARACTGTVTTQPSDPATRVAQAQLPPSPPTPMRSPQAEAAERRIRAMRPADVSGLPSLIAEVRACAEADRAPLFQLLRRRVEEFVPKRKDREALLQRYPELRGEEP